MNLVIFVPLVVLLVAVLVFLSRRRGTPGSGLGNRHDSREPPELRGDTQWRSRHGRDA